MSPRPRRRRTIALLFALAALATLVLAGLSYRKIVSRWVTKRALEDAEALVEAAMEETERAGEDFDPDNEMDEISEQLAEDYGDWFRRDFLDRGEIVRRLPAAGLVPECLPPLAVFSAYYTANSDRYDALIKDGASTARESLVVREFRVWADVVLPAPHAKEFLVNLLVSDYTMYPEGRRSDFISGDYRPRDAGFAKRLLAAALCWDGEPGLLEETLDLGGDDDEAEFRRWQDLLLATLDDSHWRAVLRDLDHRREKVRAGSLLLLWRHPRRELLVEKARAALGDPSRSVRLAAAGLLALEGIDQGAEVLANGLEHERWEVRWWCGFTLASLGPRWAERAAARAPSEPDEWVRDQLREMPEKLRALREALRREQRSP